MKKRIAVALAVGLMVPCMAPAHAATKEVTIESMKFKGMDAPKTIEQMVDTYTGASIEVTYSNGLKKDFPLSYNRLFKSEDKVAENKGQMIAAGTPIDFNGNPIMDTSAEGKPVPFVSDAPDSNSVMKVGNDIYMVTHYEYQTIDAAGKSAYGLVPASMSLTKLVQDKKTGKLVPDKVSKIDFSSVNGLWIPCNGSLSPWGTHLGSEEYEPDARSFEDKKSNAYTQVSTFAKLYFGDEAKANPYNYGWIPEITVNKDGSTKVAKHYSTGRFSHELMKVMPDNRTAYFGDDGGNTMMFMYVADKEKDFSAGTLYAAKFKQTGTENGGSGDLQWMKIGHSTDDEVKAIIDKGTKFSDIFETSDTAKEGFTAVKTYASKNVEYLKLKPGMEKAAQTLETRRYAAMKGATSEFNKMEGLAYNTAENKVYVAISDLSGSMEKDAAGNDPTDDIQLPKRKSGVTFELDLKGQQMDSEGKAIDSANVAASMKGLLVGEDLAAPDAYGNTANPDKVASPDNLSFSDDMNTLFIGEDSGMHTNNFVWAYDLTTKELSRVLSVPAGAEATGLKVVEGLMDHNYIMSNFQHPGDELDGKKITAVNPEELKAAMEKGIGIDKTGGIGYIGGLPMGKAGDKAVGKLPIARIILKHETPLYKMAADGSLTQAGSIKNGAFRVYGQIGDLINVGGDYYVKSGEARAQSYQGRILIKKPMALYNKDGKVYRMLKKGEAIKVYGMGSGRYEVGNGYYVNEDHDAVYYEGIVTIKKDTDLFKDGNAAKTLKKGLTYRVYGYKDGMLDLGGGYYTMADTSVEYSKN
ncbi:DUF839 domain-containing protein [Metabacillus sp. GX 13764]|uniref:PhoX family protein n=1 Tax=Metabacillus kandeliae TaxID=2900151 RepID=UPI001E2ECADE|nr:alkaline phosphatase PhoX [Metabacillus kandeliae]MCD7033281.1 DUF839 domain-containing protein [Metabacillus kandeliae]